MQKQNSQYDKTYNCWNDMWRRCTKPNAPDFNNYGGRGIAVCERWSVFENFISDMGLKPDGLTIERRENDGNYESNNCLWATRSEQRVNQRDIHFLEINGVKKPLKYVALEYGIKPWTLNQRLQRGWNLQRALTHPISKQHSIMAEISHKARLASALVALDKLEGEL